MNPGNHRHTWLSGTTAFLLLGSLLLSGCSGSESTDRLSGTLEGTVIFREGDFMPGSPTGTRTPVVREVLIFEAAAVDDVTYAHTPPDPFYSAIHTKHIAAITSDINGRFTLSLPAGQYSLFVREDDLYYSNSFDRNNLISPVRIISGATTTFEFNITYQATY